MLDRSKTGRAKGVPNRFGRQVKENIIAVFNRLGGTHAMAEWARENRTDFYRIYAQLIPKHVTADVNVNVTEVDLTDDELATIATGGSLSAADETGSAEEPQELH